MANSQKGAIVLCYTFLLTLSACFGVMPQANFSSSELSISNAKFTGNSGNVGGGLAVSGPLQNCTLGGGVQFQENTAAQEGGGLSASEMSTLTVDGTSFIGNTAGDSGGAAILKVTEMALHGSES